MAGFFSNTWNNITGQSASNRATSQYEQGKALTEQGGQAMTQAEKDLQNQAKQYGAQGQALTQGAAESYGANAGEAQQKAYESAQGIAGKQAATAATQGAATAVQGARTAGLSPAQAAQMGAQTAGSTYTTTQNQAIPQQMANYYGAAGQMGNLGTQQQGQAITASGTAGGIGASQAGVGSNVQGVGVQSQEQGQKASGGLVGGVLNAVFSDKRVKEDIEKLKNLRSKALDNVKPVSFDYKEEYKDNPDEPKQIGIIAQDLEKGPLKSTVIDTPKGKMIDTRKLTTANTAMLADLNKEVERIARELGR